MMIMMVVVVCGKGRTSSAHSSQVRVGIKFGDVVKKNKAIGILPFNKQ